MRMRAMGTRITVHFVLRPIRRFKLSGDIGCVAESWMTLSGTRRTSFSSLRGGRPGEGGGVNMKESRSRSGGTVKEREGKECGPGRKVSRFCPS
jgi:hypothetical protein